MSAFFKKYRFWFRCWGIVWGVLALVFSFYMVTFFLGNHDWQFIRYDMPLNSGLWEARITQFVPPFLLSLGRMLPIWNTLWGLMFLSAAAVLLAKWYEMPPKYLPVVLFSLLIALHPYVCTSLYYAYLFLSFGCWHFLTVLGVVVAWEFAGIHKIRYFIGALLCLWSALAGYAACIELIGVLFIGRLLLDCSHPISKGFLKKRIIFGGSLLAVSGVYFLSLKLFLYMDILASWMYNTQTLPVMEILSRFVKQWRTPFAVLNADFPYVDRGITLFFWGLVLVFNLVLWQVYRLKKYIMVLGLELCLFYAAFTAAYISSTDAFYLFRVHAFSVPYLAAVMLMFVWCKGNRLSKNAAYIISLYLCFVFGQCDFNVQKVWYLGNRQDDKIVERIKSNLLPQMVAGQHYRLSTLGNLYGQRKFAKKQFIAVTPYGEYYNMPYVLDIFFSSGFFAYEPYNPIWGDSQYLPSGVIFYGTTNENLILEQKSEAELFARCSWTDKDILTSKIRRLKPYPKQPYMYVGDKDIFLMLSDGAHKEMLIKEVYRQE